MERNETKDCAASCVRSGRVHYEVLSTDGQIVLEYELPVVADSAVTLFSAERIFSFGQCFSC